MRLLSASLAASLSTAACGPPSPEPQPPNEPLIMRPNLREDEAHSEVRAHEPNGTSAFVPMAASRARQEDSRSIQGLHDPEAVRREAIRATLLPHLPQGVCHSASPPQRDRVKFPAIAATE
jgi:hypothetical protein